MKLSKFLFLVGIFLFMVQLISAAPKRQEDDDDLEEDSEQDQENDENGDDDEGGNDEGGNDEGDGEEDGDDFEDRIAEAFAKQGYILGKLKQAMEQEGYTITQKRPKRH